MANLSLLFDAPVLNLQLLVDGILVGAIFALVAYGMALVWGVMNLINVAQGEFVLLAATSCSSWREPACLLCSLSRSPRSPRAASAGRCTVW